MNGQEIILDLQEVSLNFPANHVPMVLRNQIFCNSKTSPLLYLGIWFSLAN